VYSPEIDHLEQDGRRPYRRSCSDIEEEIDGVDRLNGFQDGHQSKVWSLLTKYPMLTIRFGLLFSVFLLLVNGQSVDSRDREFGM
jgi:hypothetical protein